MGTRRISQHIGNEIHVYCRICDLRIPKTIAKKMARAWGRIANFVLYRENK